MHVVTRGQTINTDYYLKTLEETVIPWANVRYGEHQRELIQYHAPCHVSKKPITRMTPRMQFWPKRVFLPSSPDLGVLGYAILAHLQENVNKKSYNSVDALLKAIKSSWKVMKPEWVEEFNVCTLLLFEN